MVPAEQALNPPDDGKILTVKVHDEGDGPSTDDCKQLQT